MNARFQTLLTKDGFQLPVWVARPETAPRAGVIVLQEIFGLTGHITYVCERLAEAGYLAIAPDLFARSGVTRPLSYDRADAGLEAVASSALTGLDSDIDAVHEAFEGLSVGVIGFCWGGGLAWRTACRLRIQAASCFYPTKMDAYLAQAPECDLEVHVAVGDRHTPDIVLDRMRAMKPGLEIHAYEEQHGFMCELREGYGDQSAQLAWRRVFRQFQRALTGSDTGR